MTAKPLLTTAVPVVDAMMDVLEAAGIDMVFGVSGGQAGKLIPALERRKKTIRSIFARQETLITPMAETYGRLTGRPGVVFGQGPWMAGWGMPGIMEAAASSSPMVVIADISDLPPFGMQAPAQSGNGDYGTLSFEQSFGAVVKQVFVASEPAEVVIGLQLALKHAVSGEPGPVALLVKTAAITGVVGPETLPRLYDTRSFLPQAVAPANASVVDHAARALVAAQRPVIIAGNGVRVAGAYAELRMLAERLEIPVVTSMSGKGCFPESHALALGPYGAWGIPAANAGVAEADLVLVVGSRLGASDTGMAHAGLIDPVRQSLIQLDVEPKNAGWTFPVDHALVGDLSTVLTQLHDAIPDEAVARPGMERVSVYRAEHGYFNGAAYDDDSAPAVPQRIVGEMRKALPANAVVTCDAGENRVFVSCFYETFEAQGLIQSGNGCMGYAIPSAIAQKLLTPNRPVVAVCGDGGFSMTMNGLMTAVQDRIPIVVVIMNNHYLGESLHGRDLEFGTELGYFKYASIAESMGCHGIHVDKPDQIGPAIVEALAEHRPTVIDVEMSAAFSYLDLAAQLDK